MKGTPKYWWYMFRTIFSLVLLSLEALVVCVTWACLCEYVIKFDSRLFDDTFVGILSFFVTFGIAYFMNLMLTKHAAAIESFNAFSGQCYDFSILLLGMCTSYNQEEKDDELSSVETTLATQIVAGTAMLSWFLKRQLRDSDNAFDFSKHKGDKSGSNLQYLVDQISEELAFKSNTSYMELNKRCTFDGSTSMMSEFNDKFRFKNLNTTGGQTTQFETMFACILNRLELLKDLRDQNKGVRSGLNTVEWQELVQRTESIWSPYGDMVSQKEYELPNAVRSFYMFLLYAYYILLIPILLTTYGFSIGISMTVLMVVVFTGGFQLSEQISNPYVSVKKNLFFYERSETVSTTCETTSTALVRLLETYSKNTSLSTVLIGTRRIRGDFQRMSVVGSNQGRNMHRVKNYVGLNVTR